jgi:hypothetical protein
VVLQPLLRPRLCVLHLPGHLHQHDGLPRLQGLVRAQPRDEEQVAQQRHPGAETLASMHPSSLPLAAAALQQRLAPTDNPACTLSLTAATLQ